MKQPTVEHLQQLGFDLTDMQITRSEGAYLRVRCSQCEAVVINGTPCHEVGCPNGTTECQQCGTPIPRPRRLCENCAGEVPPY